MTVSVLVPAYNAATTIVGTLTALAGQTRPADEIIVCDDGSTDGTSARANAVPGVRVIRQSNGGVSAARNAMLEVASGEIVMFCDADDVPHRDWIERLAGRLERSGADIAMAGVFAGRDLDERRYDFACEAEAVISGDVFYRHQLTHAVGTYSYLPCAAFRRSLLTMTPQLRFVVGLRVQEDEVFLLGCARRARSVAVSPECLYDYVYRPQSACALFRERSGRGGVTKVLRLQYVRRDWAKFCLTGRPSYAAKALFSFIRSLGCR